MKLPKIVEKELEQTRLPYQVVPGTNHRKIWLAGYFIGILPRGKTNAAHCNRGDRNLCANIRRVARIVQQGQAVHS